MRIARMMGLGVAFSIALGAGLAVAASAPAQKQKAHPELRWFACNFEGASELVNAGTTTLAHEDSSTMLLVVDDQRHKLYVYDGQSKTLDTQTFATANVTKTFAGWEDVQRGDTGNVIQVTINFDITRKQISKFVQFTTEAGIRKVIQTGGGCGQIPPHPFQGG